MASITASDLRAPRTLWVRIIAAPCSTAAQWAAFARRYRAEMAAPDASRTLDLLAALSRHSDFSVGCYCEDEAHCHRAVLRALLDERGAKLD